jgi:hypothetical protein
VRDWNHVKGEGGGVGAACARVRGTRTHLEIPPWFGRGDEAVGPTQHALATASPTDNPSINTQAHGRFARPTASTLGYRGLRWRDDGVPAACSLRRHHQRPCPCPPPRPLPPRRTRTYPPPPPPVLARPLTWPLAKVQSPLTQPHSSNTRLQEENPPSPTRLKPTTRAGTVTGWERSRGGV